MTLEEIIKLIDAGYTKEELMKLNEPAKEKHAEEKPAEEKPAPKQEEPTEKPDTQAAILAELQQMRKSINAMNIMNSGTTEQAETTDDILMKAMKGGR